MKACVCRLLAVSVLILTGCQVLPPPPTITPTSAPIQEVDDPPPSPTTADAPPAATPQPPTPPIDPTSIPASTVTAIPTATTVPKATAPASAPSPMAAREPTLDPKGARAAIRDRVTRAATRMGEDDISERAEIIADLQAALEDYLKSVGSIETLISHPASRDDLAEVLTLSLPAHGGITAASYRPTIQLITLKAGGIVLLVDYSMLGLPVLGAGEVGGKTTTAALPSVAGLDPQAMVHFDRAADLTGDGVNDLVLTAEVRGASDAIIDLAFVTWTATGPHRIFSTTISQWAGPAEWRLVSNGSGQDLVVRCAAFGSFDHKLLAHPQLTKTYRWDGRTFSVVAAELTPPVSPRDAFNRAEAAFRAGDLATAITRFNLVIQNGQLPPDEDAQTDWSALARLRIGQSQALSGDLPGARQSLTAAESAGGTIGEFARTFRTALDQPDGVVRGFAALQATDLEQRLYNNTAGNIGFSVDPTGLAWPGLAIPAYLQAHPESVQATPEELRAALELTGLRITALSEADLDGDGSKEIVVLLPVGSNTAAWIIRRDGGHPAALLVDSPGLGFSRIAGVEPGSYARQQLAVLVNGGNASLTETRLGLADGVPAFYAPDHTLLVQALPSAGGQCRIAEGLRP